MFLNIQHDKGEEIMKKVLVVLIFLNVLLGTEFILRFSPSNTHNVRVCSLCEGGGKCFFSMDCKLGCACIKTGPMSGICMPKR